MPTYEYTCRDCGHTFDIVQSMLDETLTMCPECGGSLRKVFAPPAIAFKGSGFYATDHGKKAKRSESEAKKETDRSSGASGDGPSSDGKSSSNEPATEGSKGSTEKPSTTKKEPAPS
ncbi:MAG TPA: FmdB family zinc ribbon protein [Actinomycetota bacterium]|nr:FmdB family zinc ribbon protein [Actinomycetota bacterium]